MVKKVAGGRFGAASEAGPSSPTGLPRESSSTANAEGAAQRLIESAATAMTAGEANFSDFI
ncbi:hypothetical protein [Bradyrhizobium sp. ISRA437]|uniref:hypothetical protein n=1 Tax=Bradyrhizobium sp. ISRA437 TaxID=2866196 RepID=UPI00247AB8AA|nr:hypothetical protein [Bradyrhizobium sp. ISRA437]WGS04367.1 hypothetical protein MTX18_24090 [Bradyrhizobium sp. ISRA437]